MTLHADSPKTYTQYDELIVNNAPSYAYPYANPQECAHLCDLNSECSGYVEAGCHLMILDTTTSGEGDTFFTHPKSELGKLTTKVAFNGTAPPPVYFRSDRLTTDQKTALDNVTSSTNREVVPANPHRHFIPYKHVDIVSDFPSYYMIKEGMNEMPPFVESSPEACMQTCLKYPSSDCMAVSVKAMGDNESQSPYVQCQMKNLTFCNEDTGCRANKVPGTDVYARAHSVVASMNKALSKGNGDELFAFGKVTRPNADHA
jgi:hypothetical protein